jgi:hypothetical protein
MERWVHAQPYSVLRSPGRSDLILNQAEIWPRPPTPAATVIVPSARPRQRASGWPSARPNCCRCRISTWCSRFPARIANIAYQNKAVIRRARRRRHPRHCGHGPDAHQIRRLHAFRGHAGRRRLTAAPACACVACGIRSETREAVRCGRPRSLPRPGPAGAFASIPALRSMSMIPCLRLDKCGPSRVRFSVVKVITTAYDNVCEALHLVDARDSLNEIIAKIIIELRVDCFDRELALKVHCRNCMTNRERRELRALVQKEYVHADEERAVSLVINSVQPSSGQEASNSSARRRSAWPRLGQVADRSGQALPFVRRRLRSRQGAVPKGLRQASVRRSSGRSTSFPLPRGHASSRSHALVDGTFRVSVREPEREIVRWGPGRAWRGFPFSPTGA